MTETDIMLTSILKCRPIDLLIGSKELTTEQQSKFDQMLKRRSQGEPLQYILGNTDFMGIPITVDGRVLIPRPETEILAELAIEKAKGLMCTAPLSILDLGTGSGNIAIAMARSIPNCSIIAVDISEEALEVAHHNADVNAVGHKIKFILRDIYSYLRQSLEENIKFDLIISNPPYIATSKLAQLPKDVQREPRIALDGGDDGLKFYEIIIQYGYQILKSDGFLMLEIGDEQSGRIKTMFKKYPQYQNVHLHKDYIGTNRIITSRIMHAKINY